MNYKMENDEGIDVKCEIEDLMENFLFHCQYEKNLSEKTLKAYRTDLNQFLDYLKVDCGTVEVMNIDKHILRGYLKKISRKNKPKTIKRKMATLKAFFSHLEFEDTIVVNPFRKIRIKIKEGKQLPRIIDLVTIKKIFKHIYNKLANLDNLTAYEYKTIVRDIAVLELLFSTGIRVSELCNLKKEDVDLQNETLRIIGKGNKERIIPICTPDAVKAIKRYSNLFKPFIKKNDFFFINRLNKRFSEQSVRFMIKKYREELCIKKNITPHMFRHSVATFLMENEVDIRYIQHLLGHASINTTEIYLHVNPNAQRRIITKNHPRNKCTSNYDGSKVDD